ncbi:hypothetical protein C8J36_104141 [Rhizobium sp. PP-F2F-G48]|uniref:hypothetical protein n=1 Tax=Rhizobium sp. PP-F2F-G48 TaxID=2135651 RepID=UPI0010457DE7|nr:hypothetical protein [Rhizobium sp. PP-F2F-G48]TCM54949.1 hypothetical protein C8J36_104141 [Rhizobium sp. PP-F2F-G48]
MSEAARTQAAATLLVTAVENFDQALATTHPIYFAVLGLDAIAQAVAPCRDLVDVEPQAAARIAEQTHPVAARIAEAIATEVPADIVYAGFGAAKDLVTVRSDALRADRSLYVAMILGDLRSYLCRIEIRRRGDPLRHLAREQAAFEAFKAGIWTTAGFDPRDTQSRWH